MQYKKVARVFRNTTDKWCTVTVEVNGKTEKITSTPGHKYYLPFNSENREKDLIPEHANYITLSDKWVSACKLKPGDKVLLFNKTYAIIKAVEVVCLATPEVTYNFEVEDFHTYFVGNNPILVHNANCGGDFKKYSADEIAKRGKITAEQFHRDIKPQILKASPKSLGKNPDILLNKENIVGLSSRIKKESYNTGKHLIDFIKRK